MASYPCYAFDGIVVPTSSGGKFFHSASGQTIGYVLMYNPDPLMFKKLTIINQPSYSSRSSKAGTIYGSNNNTDWDVITTYTNNGANSTWYIDLSSNTNYYKYYKMYSEGTVSNNYWTINEIYITAYTE